MSLRRKHIAVTVCLWLLLCALALAQTPSQTTEPRSLDNILAVEDPAARLTALQQFLKANPTGEKALGAREAIVASYAQLGETQLGDNNIEKALDVFQRAIRALPKQVSDRFFEETVIKIPMAVSTRGYRAEAVTLGKMLETRFANEAERLAALGEFYLTIEASGEAVTPLENAVRLTPEDARLHRALGKAYTMCLRISDAVASYQLAVRYDPKDRRAFYDLADLYRSQGAYDDALKLYQRQLEIDPKHTASYKGLALAYTALGKDTEAAAALSQVQDLRGSRDEITQDNLLQTQLAFYYLAQGKLKAARQAADAALAVEPRYSWARIAAAEVELADGRYFEAERHLLAAQQFANFPTLAFTLGKLYLIVEDFDGASEQFAKAFSYTAKDKFTTRLGGVRDVQADELKDLLAPEHQAAIFLAEPPTSDALFEIAESLTRTNAKLQEKAAEKAPDAKAAPAPKERNNDKLEQAARAFVEAEGSRRSFRALYMAQRLSHAGQALPLAIKLTDQALELAEVATELEGSVRDYPNYDRDGRLHVFRGRAYDARGWAWFKAGRNREALLALSEAVTAYGPLPEGRRALWHLATAKETAGELPVALELYLAAYEPPANKNSADVNRTVIELLYRKLHGSLNGLSERLGQPLSPQTTAAIAGLARSAAGANRAAPEPAAASVNTNVAAAEPAKTATTEAPSNAEFNVNQLLANRRQEDKPAANKPDPRLAAPVNQSRGNANSASAGNTGNNAGNKAAGEPLRVGLYGIPVNSGAPRITPSPASTSQTKPNVVSETASIPPARNQTATPPPAPVVAKEETAKEEVTKELVAEVGKEVSRPPAEETKQPVAAPPETLPDNPPATTETKVEAPAANTKAAPTPVEPEPFIPPPTRLVVPEMSPRATREVKFSEAVQLPELDQEKLAAVPLVATFVPELEVPALLPLLETPEPPAARVTTDATAGDPVITIRYEKAPDTSAAANQVTTPPAPVSKRPRRVSELVPIHEPAVSSRKRRVTPAPGKP